MKNCPKCGREISDDQEICDDCQREIDEAKAKEEEIERERERLKAEKRAKAEEKRKEKENILFKKKNTIRFNQYGL